MKQGTIAGLCAAIVLGAAATGCTSSDALELDSQTDVSADNNQTMPTTTDSDVVLPAGVLPPNNPPAPGEAPLGEDGHYNYDAPEFVLTNPCDDPEIMDRLARIGYREQQYIESRIDGLKQLGCTIESEDKSLIGLWHTSLSNPQLHNYNSNPVSDSDGNFSWVTYRQSSPLGATACITSVETAKGALGFIIDTSEADLSKPDSELCASANAVMIDYLGEI